MAIRLIPKEYDRTGRPETPSDSYFLGVNSRLFLNICIGLLVFSCLAFGGLWLYEGNLEKRGYLAAKQAQVLQDKRDVELEEMLIELDSAIEKLEEILENRIYPVNIFKMLEDLVLPEVYFSGFSADIAKTEIRFKAEATSYNKLAEQMVIFKEDPRVKNIGFSGIALGKTGVSSDFQIILNDAVLAAGEGK